MERFPRLSPKLGGLATLELARQGGASLANREICLM